MGNPTNGGYENYLNNNFFPEEGIQIGDGFDLGSVNQQTVENPSPDGNIYVNLNNLRPDLQRYFMQN